MPYGRNALQPPRGAGRGRAAAVPRRPLRRRAWGSRRTSPTPSSAPRATTARTLRSGGNLGLTQISHATARRLGYSGTPAGLFEPDTNLRYGMKYLAQAYRLAGGDTCGTILRYNAERPVVQLETGRRPAAPSS